MYYKVTTKVWTKLQRYSQVIFKMVASWYGICFVHYRFMLFLFWWENVTSKDVWSHEPEKTCVQPHNCTRPVLVCVLRKRGRPPKPPPPLDMWVLVPFKRMSLCQTRKDPTHSVQPVQAYETPPPPPPPSIIFVQTKTLGKHSGKDSGGSLWLSLTSDNITDIIGKHCRWMIQK